MSTKNGSILQFFKPAQEGPKAVGGTNNSPPKTITATKNARPPRLPTPTNMPSLPSEPRLLSSQRIIKSSDDEEDEESDSDGSLVDLTELLQSRSTSYHPAPTTILASPTPVRSRPSRGTQHASSLTFQPKSKYKFGLKALVSQSQKHEATEASAQRVQAILDDRDKGSNTAQLNGKEDQNSLLESVIAEKDGGGVEKVLQAVRRTEATTADKSWYFFDPHGEAPYSDPREFPVECAVESWQKKLVRRKDRESSIQSGFIKDMVTKQPELPEELFLWILDEVCRESNHDLQKAYCDVLLAAPEAIHKYLRPDIVKDMFNSMGARRSATDLMTQIEVVNVSEKAYEKRDWSVLSCMIKFLGDASKFAAPATCSFTMSLIARLCVDSIVWDNIGLFSTVQRSMTLLCKAIQDDDRWELSCRNVCKYIYKTVPQATLCIQILRCIPESDARLHELRRRLALAIFCQDFSLTELPVQQHFDLWKLNKEFGSPRFKVNKETDYLELAATMSLLDIALDNGHSDDFNLNDPQVEKEFNDDVDALAYQIKILWSSISEVGASFITRIDAKEVMEGVRNRLIYTVRTRPKPRPSLFDLPGKKDEESVRKQSTFMEMHFKKAKTDDGGSGEPVGSGNTMGLPVT